MVVRNDLDRFHLAGDVVDRVSRLAPRAGYAKQFLRDKLIDHENYIRVHGQDLPEVRNWRWGGGSATPAGEGQRSHGRAPRAPD
jgi:xylulose-5-phosphate/fructose-6-phosphate phosphoketolase